MKSFFSLGRNLVIFTFILPLMSVLLFFIYKEYIQTKTTVFQIMQSHIINEKTALIRNFSDFLIDKTNNNLQKLIINDPDFYAHIIKELRLIQGDEIKYLYILYKDHNDKLRYLMDATLDTNERSIFNQAFNPQTDIWDQAYLTKKVQITKQKDRLSLWVSIAYPIVVKGEVVALIGADFDYSTYNEVVKTLQPLETLYIYISIFMIVMLLLAYILVYLYYTNRKKSFIDPLTGIYNRQYLYEYLKSNSLKDYSLMMLDIDHFKRINDNYGHHTGDKVLVSIANELKSQIREDDVLVRFGGEEFLILMKKQTGTNFITAAQRIRKAVKEHHIPNIEQELVMTISIGINPYPSYAKDFDEAIKITDEQLYNAKVSGRDCVKISTEVNQEQSQISKRISDVRSAIDEKRIKCMYQPIVSVQTGKVVKYELLLRLIDLDGKIVSPMEFLPATRHTSVYTALTKVVLDDAFEVLSHNNDFELTINLDLQDLTNYDIMKLLEDTFKDYPALAQRLYLEILEHEEITEFDLIKEQIQKLKKLGFKIAIDDFGSGFANFKYLLHLDIDILKLDGSIIRDINTNKKAYHIVETIADFANKIGIKTVAEQIETQEELDTVKSLGVNFVQGYYLGRPSFEFITI